MESLSYYYDVSAHLLIPINLRLDVINSFNTEIMMRNFLIACVHAAVITDVCFDPEENDDFLDCAEELKTIYYDCMAACPDPSCMSRCNRDYEYAYKNCPCQENCPTGCPCDNYVCQTTTVKARD